MLMKSNQYLKKYLELANKPTECKREIPNFISVKNIVDVFEDKSKENINMDFDKEDGPIKEQARSSPNLLYFNFQEIIKMYENASMLQPTNNNHEYKIPKTIKKVHISKKVKDCLDKINIEHVMKNKKK